MYMCVSGRACVRVYVFVCVCVFVGVLARTRARACVCFTLVYMCFDKQFQTSATDRTLRIFYELRKFNKENIIMESGSVFD